MATAAHTHRTTVIPEHVVSLMSAIGPTQAAARLGVSTTLLHKAKKDNAINQVVDLAAAHVLEHLSEKMPTKLTRGPQPANDALFLLATTPDKADMVRRIADTIGAELLSA